MQIYLNQYYTPQIFFLHKDLCYIFITHKILSTYYIIILG
jgi:hypothetical protein